MYRIILILQTQGLSYNHQDLCVQTVFTENIVLPSLTGARSRGAEIILFRRKRSTRDLDMSIQKLCIRTFVIAFLGVYSIVLYR